MHIIASLNRKLLNPHHSLLYKLLYGCRTMQNDRGESIVRSVYVVYLLAVDSRADRDRCKLAVFIHSPKMKCTSYADPQAGTISLHIGLIRLLYTSLYIFIYLSYNDHLTHR